MPGQIYLERGFDPRVEKDTVRSIFRRLEKDYLGRSFGKSIDEKCKKAEWDDKGNTPRVSRLF